MTTPAASSRDRRALLVFVALTVAFCTIAYVPMLTGGGFDALGGWALPLLMWSPGLAGLLTSLLVFRSLAPLGLLGNRRTLAWALACVALPVVYALVIKGGLAAAGLVGLARESLPLTMPLAGLYYALRTALGEELGWRGFAAPVVTRVFGFRRGQAYLGVFWFLFHVPALLGTSYGSSPHPWFGNLMFLGSCVALCYLLGWVRLAGASVWPCALFHASHNFYFLHLFEPLEPKHPSASYLVGEQGLLCALVLVGLAIVALRAMRRRPAVA